MRRERLTTIGRMATGGAALALLLAAGACAKWEWNERSLSSVSSARVSGPGASPRVAPPRAPELMAEWLREVVESLEPMEARLEAGEDEGSYAIAGSRDRSPMTLRMRTDRGALFETRRGERAPGWSRSLDATRLFYVSRRADMPEEAFGERGPLGFMTYMLLAAPELSEGDIPRGVALYCTGMLGLTREEFRLAEALRARGWTLLIVQPPWGVFQAAKVVLGERPIELSRFDADASKAGAAVGAMVDDGFVEWSDAVRAALALAAERWPDAPMRPRVVVSSSLGAIATPGLAAGLRDASGERAFDAAVLIGGGGDLLSVTQRSGVFRGPRLRASAGDADFDHGSSRRELIDAYRASSRLDPLSASWALRDTPVFMVQATMDDIVPTRTGNALWEALGRPARLSLATGHILMFSMLPGATFEKIVEWIEENAGR
ncbi:MAG: hypothetical protein KF684_04695 [Phycisphaeraceae bacterium]|nr:hypothetical protein [Phycisphaeraceae bacterium]